MKKLFAAVFALVLSSAAAQAATYDFDFTGGNNTLTPSITFTNGDLSLTATPASFENDGTVETDDGYRVGHYEAGLGMSHYSWDPNHQVDGWGNDLIAFDFNREVTIESVTFSYVDNNDQFSFFFDAGADGSLDSDNLSLNVDIPGSGEYTFALVWTGNLFGIGAHDPNWHDWSRDDFKISGMSVSVVPLPAALPLYGAGVIILGFLGWRRKKSQTS